MISRDFKSSKNHNSFSRGNFKSRKFGAKVGKKNDREPRKTFDLEEEMRKINQSYNIVGTGKDEKKGKHKGGKRILSSTVLSKLNKTTTIGRRRGMAKAGKSVKNKAMDRKYKKLYTNPKGKPALFFDKF